MTPQQKLEADIKDAMKARDTQRLSTLRLLLGAVKNRRIEIGDELDEAEFLTIVQKAVKQRQDAAKQYRDGNREELAAKEEAEIEVLQSYLPEQASEEEIRAAVTAFVEGEGLSGPAAMGPTMKAMMAKFGGAADGQTISKIAREILT